MGKWVETTIGAYCDPPQYGLNASAIKYDGEHGYIRITDIDDTSHRFIKSGITSPDEFSDEYLVKKGDVLLARTGASVGKSYVYDDRDGQLYFAGFLIRFRPKKDNDPGFLFYQTLTDRYAKWVANVSVRTGQPGINSLEYATYKFLAPVSLDEQRHIAEILATCDEVIEKSEAVVEKYRAIKAGMLKDLVTRGIGKNGKLRPPPESAPQLYKDTALGKVPREWKIKTIGEMFAFKNGVSKGKEYFGHGVPIVNFTDVFNKPRITPDVLEGRVEMDRHEIDSFAVKSGDVFFTRTSETPEEIGMAAVVIGEFVDTVFSGFVLRGRPISEDLENEFKVFCFRTDAVRKRIIGDCSYTTRALTNGGKLSAIKMGVPSTCEQRQIAERLSAIDAKIADELAVVAKYRKVKTGLMARLLTPPDGEVE